MRRAGRWVRVAAAALFWFLAYQYLTTPDVRSLRTRNPTTTAFMERRIAEAEREGRRFAVRRRWVPYSRISNSLKRAVLVAEDSSFWQHDGIDLDQIRESFEINVERMSFARGASTITQQLAKNLYLSPSKDPVRKLRELMIARRLEAALGKRRILEVYLNVIEWGDGIFGAEAAARAYFGMPAAALGPEPSALLAAAIINPRALSPGRPSARLVRRQRMILRRMGRVVPPPNVPPPSAAQPPGAQETPTAIEAPAPPIDSPPDTERPPAEDPPPASPGDETEPPAERVEPPREPRVWHGWAQHSTRAADSPASEGDPEHASGSP